MSTAATCAWSSSAWACPCTTSCARTATSPSTSSWCPQQPRCLHAATARLALHGILLGPLQASTPSGHSSAHSTWPAQLTGSAGPLSSARWRQVRSFGVQLLEATAFLHELTLIHTDLKPENILLASSEYNCTPPVYGSRSGPAPAGSHHRSQLQYTPEKLSSCSLCHVAANWPEPPGPSTPCPCILLGLCCLHTSPKVAAPCGRAELLGSAGWAGGGPRAAQSR